MHQDLDQNIYCIERRIKELQIECEALSRHQQELFKELEVTDEELLTLVKDPSNFSLKSWEYMQEEKRKIEERLNASLKGIKDPRVKANERIEKLALLNRL